MRNTFFFEIVRMILQMTKMPTLKLCNSFSVVLKYTLYSYVSRNVSSSICCITFGEIYKYVQKQK